MAILRIGVTPLLLAVLCSASFFALCFSPQDPTSTAGFTLWTFTPPHYEAYVRLTPQVEKLHKVQLQPHIINASTIEERVRSAIWADLPLPPLIEMGVDNIQRLSRGSRNELRFADLRPFLEERYDGKPLREQLVASRVAALERTIDGETVTLGLPHDVHPVLLAYRRDLFEKHGVDMARIETWDEFFSAGRKVAVAEDAALIELDDIGSSSFEILLYQNGDAYFDTQGNVVFDRESVRKLLAWYVRLVAQGRPISANPGFGPHFNQMLLDGKLLSFLCFDWRTRFIEMGELQQLSGQMALTPLPATKLGGRRASACGGTGIVIVKDKDVDRAVEVAKTLYFDVGLAADQFRQNHVLTPFKPAWSHAAFHETSPFWSNQVLGEQFIRVALDSPPRPSNPFASLAQGKIAEVLASSINYHRSYGEHGFEDFIDQSLTKAAVHVRRHMQRTRN